MFLLSPENRFFDVFAKDRDYEFRNRDLQ